MGASSHPVEGLKLDPRSYERDKSLLHVVRVGGVTTSEDEERKGKAGRSTPEGK